MKNLRRVVWSKGMFLTPQHFQAQDNAAEDALHFRFAASTFANWGITHITIDQESLANGVFTIERCRGLLADGLPFSMPQPDAGPRGQPVAEHFSPSQAYLDVYLALPERLTGAKNFSPSPESGAGAASTRFVAENLDVGDEGGSGDMKTVQLARKNFRLLFGEQNREGYSGLRIARVVRSETGAFTLDPSFVAPCLDIASSEYLMGMLRRQIEILTTKSNSLSSSRRQRGQSLADFNTGETANFWLLHTVNTSLPELSHIWSTRHGHPETLYVAMLRLAGALATFSLELSAREVPAYDHDNLGPCFTELDEKIRLLLETVVPSKCISIPLRLDRSIWSGTITSDQYFKESQFFLAISAKMGVDDLIGKVPKLVKVSPTDEIDNLIRRALPGLTLRHMPAPPPAVTFRLDNQYFSINQSGILWERITQSRNISLFLPPDLVSAKPELLVVLK